MRAEELIKSGDVDGALGALQESTRKNPEDARLRIFLFQVLCIKGDWTRAILQLKTCATLDPSAGTMAQMYREAIRCEMYRDQVFAGKKPPLIFGEPVNWMAMLVEALKLQGQSDLQAADDLRAQAFDSASPTTGDINGTPFAWIADADPRLGPVLEVIIEGRYFWVPFSAITRITIEPPADLRDAVWTPATITWTNGGDAIGLIPTRYPGSAAAGNPSLQLARGTEWTTAADVVIAGLGQRMFVTDTLDVALMDIRTLTLNTSDPSEHG
ncbi:virulence protein SciE type [Loktanella sp. D2R18]|uniref:type VI secretion system accessory protein TagJ n=1 Tax=Rhodobacterales TaxID=204455 RepID=UPI000DE9F948|nr:MULTISPECIES: type VI secretion system accessory protein TagJ [Rhodobacterales]MDO6590542.1 type VI secretion system accessory protein TagJ [Yoonia sp. 1_MG-2023]RBW41259.1 virulence protein SciE type [Loktanella sp. D2R18]